MNQNNLQRRIKKAWFQGHEARRRGKRQTDNPFLNYDGINGDGHWIQQAYSQGWQEYDGEPQPDTSQFLLNKALFSR